MQTLAGAIIVAGGTIGHAIAFACSTNEGDRISGQIPADIALVAGTVILIIGLVSSSISKHNRSD
jgi:putative Ca2+/H+ antiporter (TMEM165/GDT1 family)